MMKKTLQLLLALFAFTYASAQDFSVGDLAYTILSGTEVEVQGFSGTEVTAITVPETVENGGTTYNVTGLGLSAFENSGVTTVQLTSNVVSIGKKAFGGCGSLQSIEGTSSVTFIGDYCFNNCKALTKLELPALVTIGTGAIYNSSTGAGGISSFNIPSSVTTIGALLLGKLQNLTAVQVNWTDPANDVSVNGKHFFRAISIATEGALTLYVPVGTKAAYEAAQIWGTVEDPLSSNPNGPFHHNNIVEGTIPEPALDPVGTTFTIADIEYRVTNVDDLEVEVASSTLAAITVPATVTKLDGDAETYSVTAIGGSAFLDNTSVTSVALPTSVVLLKGDAFSGCVNLETINLENIVVTNSYNVFYNCPKLMTVNLAAATDIGKFLFYGLNDSSLASISIPSAVTIGKSAFNRTIISSINIPSSVVSIEDKAFMDCASLTAIQVNWTTSETIPEIIANTVDAGVFLNLTPADITLYVPVGTAALYEAAAVWTDFTIVEGILSVNDVNDADFSIYPNPTNDLVSVSSKTTIIDVTVLNANGSILFNSNATQLDLSALASGVYFLKVKTLNGVSVKRVIKK